MRRPTLPAVACLLALGVGTAVAQPAVPERGQTLYELHCIGCHTTQMHWRAQRQATDWASLRGQVRLWQGNALLNWKDDDIDAVAHFLNQTIYRFPEPARPIGRRGPGDGRHAARAMPVPS
jgi:mono/diheme cytochrome c family protein